jgi:nucleotide-binding universal stress UspA family protein
MSKILACLDASIYAQSVVDHTIWAAQRMGAAVEMISTRGRYPTPEADLEAAKALDTQPGIVAQELAADVEHDRKLDALASAEMNSLKRQLENAGVTRVSTELLDGAFLDELKAHQDSADLLVLGKRGSGADFVSMRLGSQTERAARAADRDVLIAARGFRRPRKALVAIDVGETGEALCARAAASPLLKGLQIHLVTVGDPGLERRDALEAGAAVFRAAGYDVRTMLLPAPVERSVPWFADEEDMGLLVMGAFSHSLLRQLVVGSTTAELIRACKIPVLLLK